MALGESGYKAAIPLLEKLANCRFEATMILVAVGDAYVRLARKSDTDSAPVLKILGIEADRCLADGALRAVAMLRMKFSEAEAANIIHAVNEHITDPKEAEALKFWLIAACPGWMGIEVDQFIERCSHSTREDVRNAAADAKLKKYRKWRPL